MADTNQAQPEWDVSTHGPLPQHLAGRYKLVGGQSVYPLPEAHGPALPTSPDGAHVGTRVVEGPPEAGDGGADQPTTATGSGQQATATPGGTVTGDGSGTALPPVPQANAGKHEQAGA